MIKKAEGIVLRSIPYRDESKIITFYTREFGRISAIAKGSRSSKSKFASAFEVGSYVSLLLYKKSSRDVQQVTDAQLKQPMLNLTSTLEHLSILHQLVELVRLSSEDDEPNYKLFMLLLSTLKAINQSTKNLISFLFYFEVQLISHLGFKPTFSESVLTRKPLWDKGEPNPYLKLILIPDYGGVAFKSEATELGLSGRLVSVQAHRMIEHLAKAKLADVQNFNLQPKLIAEISEILETYIRYHIDDLPTLRSREVFNQLTR